MLEIINVNSEETTFVYEIQKKSFMPLLRKYEDYNTNPATESMEDVKEKIQRKDTKTYIFKVDGKYAGTTRVIDCGEGIFKIAGFCILPEYQNKGIGKEAIKIIIGNYREAKKWTLFSIKEEERNCHFYESLGFVKGSVPKKINEKMSIVYYVKN